MYAKPRTLYSVTHPECNLKIEYWPLFFCKSVGANSVRPSKKQVHDYNQCRTEQKNYPITLVGAGALDSPLEVTRFEFTIKSCRCIKTCEGVGTSDFCELANRNFAKPLQF